MIKKKIKWSNSKIIKYSYLSWQIWWHSELSSNENGTAVWPKFSDTATYLMQILSVGSLIFNWTNVWFIPLGINAPVNENELTIPVLELEAISNPDEAAIPPVASVIVAPEILNWNPKII